MINNLKNNFEKIRENFKNVEKIDISDDEIQKIKSSKEFENIDNLTDEEIKSNIINIREIINIEKKCFDSKSDVCPGNMNHHLAVKRHNGRLYFYYYPCEKIKKIIDNNTYKKKYIFNYYENSDASNVFFSTHFHKKNMNKSFINVSTIFAEHFKNDKPFNAYMYGECGIGKTFFTFAIANAYAKKKDKTICFIYMPEFVNVIKSGFSNPDDKKKSNEILNAAKLADVLVLDDIGSEYASDWFYFNYLLNILNIRQNQKHMVTIFNSNVSLEKYQKIILSRTNKMDKEIMVDRIMNRINYLIGNNEFNLKGKKFT